jgi:hypothetical protein
MKTDIGNIMEFYNILHDITRHHWYIRKEFYLEIRYLTHDLIRILDDNNINYKTDLDNIYIEFSEVKSFIRNKKLNEILK